MLDPEHDPGHSMTETSETMPDRMKAVHYEGPFKVSVKDMDVPKIQHPDDVLVKVTTAGKKVWQKREDEC